MKHLILGLLLRFAKGERYERLAPGDTRCQLAVFAAFPVFLLSLSCIGRSLWHHAGPVLICLYLLVSLLVTVMVALLWAMFIPTKASWVASILLWLFLVGVAWQTDWINF